MISIYYVAFHFSRSCRRWRGLLLWYTVEDGKIEGIIWFKTCLGDGGITVLGKEDRVGEAEFEGEGKCNCSSTRIQLPL
jgi:hypothetical protein